MLHLLGEMDLNTMIMVLGWLIGGLVVVVGMRSQLRQLTVEIVHLRQTLVVITGRIDKVDNEVAYLRGIDQGRRDAIKLED